MGHTAFRAEEYDAKIWQTFPFYEEFYGQIVDILDIAGKKDVTWLDVRLWNGKNV